MGIQLTPRDQTLIGRTIMWKLADMKGSGIPDAYDIRLAQDLLGAIVAMYANLGPDTKI